MQNSIGRLEPENIAHVAETASTNDVNEYLTLGWQLIGLSSSQSSEHQFQLRYHVAWPKTSGEPKPLKAKRPWGDADASDPKP